jgi:hypothetical protein
MGCFLSRFYNLTNEFIRHVFSWFYKPIITNSNKSVQFTSTSTDTYISDSKSIEILNIRFDTKTKIIVNGESFEGYKLLQVFSYKDMGYVVIDTVQVIKALEINIKIDGPVKKLSQSIGKTNVNGNVDDITTTTGNVLITGNSKHINNTSGIISVGENSNGYVNTVSGNVKIDGSVFGNVSTVSGNIVKN